MLCHQCGSQVDSKARKCPNCGAELKTTRRFDIATSKGLRISQEMKAIKLDAQLFPPGEMISERFKLGEMVGKGPFGEVYRAVDIEVDTDVCVKVFDKELIENPIHQERFLNTTRAARGVNQVNIVRIHDSGVHKDHPWVSMQFLEGLNLRKVLNLRKTKNEHFALDEVEPVVGQIASALNHIRRDTAHGDLKPENVLFLPEMIKVTDAYVCAAIAPSFFAERLSDSAYLAPELDGSDIEATAQADVYSLGVIIGEMVFGPDYSPGTQSGALAAVDALCKRATAFDPRERYPSVAALSKDLYTLVKSGSELAPPSPPVPPVPPSPGPPAPPAPTLAPPVPPAPPALTPAELATMELDVDDDAIEIDEDSFVVEEEMATVEYTRDIEPEIQDILPTNDVRRDQLPPPEPRRGVTKTAISAAPVAKEESDSMKWVALVAVLFVGIVLFITFGNTGDKKKEVVTIGGDKTKVVTDEKKPDVGVAKKPDAGAVAEAPVVDPKFVAAVTSAASSLRAASQAAVTEASKPAEAEPVDDSAVATKTTDTANVGLASSKDSSKKPDPVEPAKAAGTKCPGGMVLVKSKKRGNYCVDVFEYPARGVKPKTRVNWFQAKKQCTAKGKRLCTIGEWRSACGSKYPYGRSFDAARCNTVDEDGFERSLGAAGSFKRCRSRSGAYDMTGNVFEWVAERKIVGGSYESDEDVATCRYSSAKAPGSSGADIGFRCCADPE